LVCKEDSVTEDSELSVVQYCSNDIDS